MGKTKPKIGFDLDGVLAGFTPKFVEMANRKFHLKLKPEDQTSWSYTSLGLNEEQGEALWEDIKDSWNWWMSLDPLTGSEIVIDKLSEYNPIFITSRVPSDGLSLEDQSAHWLRRNFYIANPQVICEHNKGPVVAALGLKAFIDDKPENCIEIANAAPNCQVFMLVQSYNRNFFSPSITRVSNLKQFFDQIEGGLYGIREAA